MSKHRSRKKNNRSLPVDTFFSTVMLFIEKLESEEKILLVVPNGDNQHQGIVISSSLAAEINIDYVQRMAEYSHQCGSLESYFDFRSRNPKWASKHNPDQMLLNICRAVRMVIAYRYGLAIGNADYMANENGEATVSSKSLEGLDTLPLFITMMSDDTTPQSIGYELGGEITLEEYKHQQS